MSFSYVKINLTVVFNTTFFKLNSIISQKRNSTLFLEVPLKNYPIVSRGKEIAVSINIGMNIFVKKVVW